MQENTNVFKLYSTAIIYKILIVILGFLNSILINRCLGVSLRGEYTTIVNWASLFQLFLNLGIGTSYPAIKRKYPRKTKKIYSTLIFLIALIYGIVFLLASILLNINQKFILLITYIYTIENIVIFIAVVENIKKRNLLNIITSIIHTFALLIIFLFYPNNLYIILFAVFLDHLFLTLVLIVSNKMFKINFKLLKSHITYDILRISVPSMLMNMLMYLNYHADNYSVGLYGTAVTLANMLWIIPDAFKDILYNRVSKKDNPNEIFISILVNIFICGFVLAGFVVLGRGFLSIMYGNDFVDAYPLVLLLFFGTFPMILYKLIHPIYIANGKTNIVVILLFVSVIFNIIGNIVLIPKYSAAGAAVSTVISYLICGVFFYLKFKKDYSVNEVQAIKSIYKQIRKRLISS